MAACPLRIPQDSFFKPCPILEQSRRTAGKMLVSDLDHPIPFPLERIPIDAAQFQSFKRDEFLRFTCSLGNNGDGFVRCFREAAAITLECNSGLITRQQ
ncbi:hypothetical protein RB195_004227 [Necator americanus]|uniref:Uncharacterized protein n=1 Tax=Necator americanus TaxID=51031 RepID=A0ABR1BGX9_NECAM